MADGKLLFTVAKVDGGVLRVSELFQESAIDLQVGDVIGSVDGAATTTANEFDAAVGSWYLADNGSSCCIGLKRKRAKADAAPATAEDRLAAQRQRRQFISAISS